MAKIVVVNGDVVDYDRRMDWASIGEDVAVYGSTQPQQLSERAKGAEILVIKELPMGADLIQQLPDSVKMIVEAGTGYNNYDAQALQARGIALTNIPAYSTQRVAHTAIMLLLNLASSMQTQLRMLANGDHRNFSDHLLVDHIEVNDKTLGVIGFGHIGQEIIKVAQALGMKILVNTRTPRVDRDGIHFTDLKTLLQQSDFVSLNLPLTEQTHHLIDAQALALMKPSAFLINTARGGLVDTEALVVALQQGQLAGAGLDVQEVEPLPDDSPLFSLPNVIVTPHMGWRGLETRQRLVKLVGANITAWQAGDPINRVL
ncbi:2-hydroxyacid dehydrogenase [Lacticaseibacillus sp. GG6-2]